MQSILEEILQAAKEIETASESTLNACGFTNEEERFSFIKEQAEMIERLSERALGQNKGW